MKFVVILGDGMSDYKIKELGALTPLEYANTPTMDYLAKYSEIGLAKTVPDDMSPGSDVANLSVMGYDPHRYYSGRSPLEAVSMGVPLLASDMTFRCNLVTTTDEDNYYDRTMLDHSSDEISSVESKELIEAINENFRNDDIEFFSGTSYRHLMVWHNMSDKFILTPPHDILEQKITGYLPKNKIILDMMIKSAEILKSHPVNIDRIARGLRPANSIWIWGEGKKPALSSFSEKYKLNGSIISAVDLLKGIGICAGLDVVNVEGATGNIHSNFKGKAQAIIDELKRGQDFVFVHIEAPDESGHRNELENKVKSIEIIDNDILRPVYEYLKSSGEDFSLLITPDHPTPLSLRTHTLDPVPFMIYRNYDVKNHANQRYNEDCAEDSGLYIENGYELMDRFLMKG